MSMMYWNESNLKDSKLRSDFNNKAKAFVRPTAMESSPSLWGSKGVRPAAVNQGILGDCWFLASMAALGEWPDRIKGIFKNTDYSD
jgi:hypothetical protein